MQQKSYAKINLTLEIIKKLDNGYHKLKSVFQLIDLYDIVEVELNKDSDKIEISCTNPNIPTDEKNLCHKAAKLFFSSPLTRGGARRAEGFFGADIKIDKNIPTGGGLGGGSSNAAVTLKILNKLFNNLLKQKELIELGSQIGSDVPFFLHESSTALVEGVGEIITPLPPAPNLPILLIFPEVESSTQKAYQSLDLNKLEKTGEKTETLAEFSNQNQKRNSPSMKGWQTKSDGVVFSSKILDTAKLSEFFHNDFEPFVFEYLPELKDIETKLQQTNPTKVLMSGSGSTIFATYQNEIERDNAFQELAKTYNCKKAKFM